MGIVTKKETLLWLVRPVCGVLITVLLFMQSVPVFAVEPFVFVPRAPIHEPKKEEKKKKKSSVVWDLATNNFLVRKFRQDPYITILTIVSIALTAKQLGVTKKNPFARKPKNNKPEIKLTMSNLGGNEKLKEWWKTFLFRLHHAEQLRVIGPVTPPKGVLLVGPTGCGKTTFMKIIQADERINVVSVRASDILNKFVGESEKALPKLFEEARTLATKTQKPTFLFLDEAEALLGKRGRGTNNEVSDRVVSTFLTEVDGIDTHNGPPIHLILATNHKDLLDPAAIRAGRIDQVIAMDLDKEEAFKSIVAPYKVQNTDGKSVVQQVIDKGFLNRFENGAEIREWLDNAACCAVSENRTEISFEHLESCLPKNQRLPIPNRQRRVPGQLVESSGRPCSPDNQPVIPRFESQILQRRKSV